MASWPQRAIPNQEFPARNSSGYAPQTSPHLPDWSWRCLKRCNSTGSSRIPSRLTHRARPIRQSWTGPTLSRLLPPSPDDSSGDGYLQLHPAATTARRRRSPTSIRTNSASWRTAQGNNPRFPWQTLQDHADSQARTHYSATGLTETACPSCPVTRRRETHQPG